MNNIESIEINLSVKKPVGEQESSKSAKVNQGQSTYKTKEVTSGVFGNDRQSESNREPIEVEAPGIDELMEKVQQYVNTFNTKLSFSFDKQKNRPIIYVIDKETDEVIRQIPPEKMYKLINNLEEIRGIIYQGQA